MAGTTVNWKDESERNHEIVYRFEKAFNEGKKPNVDDYLEGEGVSRRKLLLELLHSDLELRIRDGQSLRVQDYLKQYAELANHPEDLASLLKTEIDCLRQMGMYPALQMYQAEYGSVLGGRLEELFAQEKRTSREAKIGSVIAGKYKLLAQLGEGGMGSVYAAEQTQPVRRTVAVKLIKPGMDSSGVLARFEAERQALAMMDHPNIARMLDGGITEDGQPYFVMEQVKGLPITKFCDQEKLSLDDRIQLFMAVCQGVQHAHQKGIIHRDLKPSNILVAMIDGKPVPKVIDFGVAKALHQKLTDKTIYTEAGRMVGTLEYMAPEQADLNNLDVDTRADVYALGVVLYELLTGQLPFTGKELRSAAYDEMLRIIREMEPPRPSIKLSSSVDLPKVAALRQVEPQHLTSEVAGELDWIVMKCLEKERSRRYETANALGRELGRYLADEPVEARPASSIYRISKLLRRNIAVSILSTTILILIISCLVIALSLYSSATIMANKERSTRIEYENQLQAYNRLISRSRLMKHLAFKMGSPIDKLIPKLDQAGYYPKQIPTADAESHVSHALAISFVVWRDSNSILSCSYDTKINFWKLVNNNIDLKDSYSAADCVLSATIIDKDDVIAVCRDMGVIDPKSSQILFRAGPADSVPAVSACFSNDSKLLAVAGRNNIIYVWDVSLRKMLYTINMNMHSVASIGITYDNRLLIIGALNGSTGCCISHNINDGAFNKLHSTVDSSVVAVAVSSKSSKFAWSDIGGNLFVKDYSSNLSLTYKDAFASCIKFSSNDNFLAAGTEDGNVVLYELLNGAIIDDSMHEQNGIVTAMAYSGDGESLCTGSDNGKLMVSRINVNNPDDYKMRKLGKKARIKLSQIAEGLR